jgi:hypothetical protein
MFVENAQSILWYVKNYKHDGTEHWYCVEYIFAYLRFRGGSRRMMLIQLLVLYTVKTQKLNENRI